MVVSVVEMVVMVVGVVGVAVMVVGVAEVCNENVGDGNDVDCS